MAGRRRLTGLLCCRQRPIQTQLHSLLERVEPPVQLGQSDTQVVVHHTVPYLSLTVPVWV